VTAAAKQWANEADAALRAHYGDLGAEIDPSCRYELVEAAGEIWAVPSGEAGRRLPAAFHGHTLRYGQVRLGWQLPEHAPRLAGVCDSLDELRDKLRGLPLADLPRQPARGWRALDF
jgi:hypothetical protein